MEFQELLGKQLLGITTDPADVPGVTLVGENGVQSYVYDSITLAFEDGITVKMLGHWDNTIEVVQP